MKYKDYRMTIIIGLLLIIVLVVFIQSLLLHNSKQAIISGAFFFIVLIMFLTMYQARLFADQMIVYSFKFIAILPVLIDYQDIKSYRLLSKHRMEIIHKKTTIIYLNDVSVFYNDFDQEYERFKKKHN